MCVGSAGVPGDRAQVGKAVRNCTYMAALQVCGSMFGPNRRRLPCLYGRFSMQQHACSLAIAGGGCACVYVSVQPCVNTRNAVLFRRCYQGILVRVRVLLCNTP